ncbi:retrovirus-related pol polyprotein from transposon TNT 1-94 [Tanacetum coccineum]|uniref:Retrovirus-related pol polyprotein from transposon TNT 1-94 n=1 Tax=Tanacetum coccineum TaxID=301880 RepID=A0ABQ5C9H3_9ASTR
MRWLEVKFDSWALAKKNMIAISQRWCHKIVVIGEDSIRSVSSEQFPFSKERIIELINIEDPFLNWEKDLVLVKSSVDDTKVSIPVVVTDSSTTDYDSTDESSVSSTPLPPLKRLDDVEPVSRQKTIKSTLRSKSTFKAKNLKGVIINEPSSAPAKGNNSSSASKVNSAPAGKLKSSLENENDPPLAIVMKELNGLTHTTTDHYDIEWFKRGEALQAKKAKALKSTRVESSNANRSKTPTKRTLNHEKYTLVIVDEYSRYTWVYFLKNKSQAPETLMSFIKRVENQNDIKVKQHRSDNVYIHNHKAHLGKFDEKADDGYLLGYSLVSKAFRVFNTRRQQIEETYHITFDESLDAIKFSKPSVDNINIAKTERYPPDEYLHPYKPSQRYQTNNNNVIFIEPYECPKPVVLETEV